MQEDGFFVSYRKKYAYSLGIQAYIYGYPLVLMERTRQLQTVLNTSIQQPKLTASNVLFHEPILVMNPLKNNSSISVSIESMALMPAN